MLMSIAYFGRYCRGPCGNGLPHRLLCFTEVVVTERLLADALVNGEMRQRKRPNSTGVAGSVGRFFMYPSQPSSIQACAPGW
jgi:hypothetical protein